MPVVTLRGPGAPPVTCRFDDDAITIGRAVSNHLVVKDPLLSRVHAELRRVDDQWFVIDRGSRNGIRVNGRVVDGHAVVTKGDEITIGGTSLQFEVAMPGGVADTPQTRTREGLVVTPSTSPQGDDGDEIVLVGSSPAMRRLRQDIRRVAPSDVTVLITGENGTGKELVAQCLHRASTRRDAPFIVVNCPALMGSLIEAELFGVERRVATDVDARIGRLELARGGTLLLDEVGDLEISAQAKLLRFLQTKTFERVGGREVLPVDVRILAATNQDLVAAIEAGRFRRDLYHRLRVVSLHAPPLRERTEDIAPLAEHFIARTPRPGTRLTREALRALSLHAWPGNVRELEHAIAGAVLFSDRGEIGLEHLPPEIAAIAGAQPPDLYERVVRGGESFWDAVREPFLRRAIPAGDVRAFVRRAHEEGGGSYRGLAKLLRMEGEYRKLVDFLRHHRLGVEE